MKVKRSITFVEYNKKIQKIMNNDKLSKIEKLKRMNKLTSEYLLNNIV